MRLVLQNALVAVLISCGTQSIAAVWTVSNNPNRPAQFTTVQAAVNAASPNDTILITGGTYGWTNGQMTTTIPLVFYGEAAIAEEPFVRTRMQSVSWNFNRLNSSLSASGSRVYGIDFTSTQIYTDGNFSGAQAGQRTMSDFIFERCSFSGSAGITVYANDGISDVLVRNCLFSGGYNSINLQYTPATGIIVTNCIFSGYATSIYFGSANHNGNVLLRNNIFLSNTQSIFSSSTGAVNNVIVENNIFYKAEPTGLNGSTFNNNLTYLCNNNDLPYGTNFGSGNIVNENPDFVSYPALGADWALTHDYALQAGSPAIGTGTNGVDMGINSGNAPINQAVKFAKIPGVTVLDIPVSSVPVGGTLQIQIEAVSRD